MPIGPYIADFVCPAARLVIEIDGDQHANALGYDAARTRYLEGRGYCVLRVPTHEVFGNIGDVLARIHLALEERVIELRQQLVQARAPLPSLPIREGANGPLLSRRERKK